MKNSVLQGALNIIMANPKAIVTKGTVGGNSIEVFIQEPVYEDLGSFLYKTTETRDADFDKLIELKPKGNA